MAFLIPKPSSITGKVVWFYALSLLAVFVTFLLAKIVGAPGEVFFIFSFYLVITELFGVPIALYIAFAFFANMLMPNLILPFIEWALDIIMGFLNLITFSFLKDFLNNPFRNARFYWVDINPEPFITLLLNAFETFRQGLMDL